MNKLPATVNVAGLTYSIVPNDDYTQGAEAYAVTSHRRLEIRIGVEPPTAVQQVRLALLHELVHTVANSYGGGSGEDLSEAWVDALSHGLFQVLRENPGAAAFILEPDGPCEEGSGSPESSNTSELVGRYPQADQLRERVQKELGATTGPAARESSERVRRYRRAGRTGGAHFRTGGQTWPPRTNGPVSVGLESPSGRPPPLGPARGAVR